MFDTIVRNLRTFCLVALMILGLGVASAKAQAPNGPYPQTCTNASTDANGTLHALCTNFFSNKVWTTLPHADKCESQNIPLAGRGQIWNVDGSLFCVVSSHPSQSGRDIFDIISFLGTTNDVWGTVDTWLIQHPDVIDPTRVYPMIPIKPGNYVHFYAGGCVQTGGMGATWKSYVFPSGDDSNYLYSGLVYVADTTPTNDGQPERVLAIMQQTSDGTKTTPPGFFVGHGTGPQSGAKPVLQLGYQDDGYSDNGYYSHDNGNNNQCENVGPAWMEVFVETPKTTSAGPVLSPYKKNTNFDTVWDVDGGVDNNSLPLNPEWSAQLAVPGSTPDFNPSCTSNGNLNTGLPTCTSDVTSEDTNSGIDTLFQLFGYCGSSAPVHGHINWSIMTYQGDILWRTWSGSWPQDNDDNFGLLTDKNIGQTRLWDSGASALGIEFSQEETLDNFSSPFWKQFLAADDTGKGNLINNKKAIVTALLGVDDVHGGYSELHPAYSMAIRTDKTSTEKTVDESWAFFIRNEGNEGSCSSNSHDWSSGDSTYTVQLPRPTDAVDTDPGINFTALWGHGNGMKSLPTEVDHDWIYVRVQMPPGSGTGIDGQLTLHYTLKTTQKKMEKKAEAVPAASRPSTASTAENADKGGDDNAEFGVDWVKVSNRITDPAKRAQFTSDLDNLFKKTPLYKAPTVAALTPDRTIVPHKKPDGNGARGIVTHDISKPNQEKIAEKTAVNALLQKYSTQLNLPKTKK